MTKEWAEHKDAITDLYSVQRLTLAKVKTIMAEMYDFKASTRAYRGQLAKWGLRKYMRRERSGQSVSPNASDSSSPNGLVLHTNGNLDAGHNQGHNLSIMEDAQIPYMSLANQFHQSQHQHQLQGQQRTRSTHMPVLPNSRRQQQEQHQGYQRSGAHGMNNLSQSRHVNGDLPFTYSDLSSNLSRTRSHQSRRTTHRMSTGFLQYPSANQDLTASHQLQYPRSYQLPNPNPQLPSPAPSPSLNAAFQGNSVTPFSMLPSRSRPRTNSTPEALSQCVTLPRGVGYYHSNQDSRHVSHPRPMCDGPEANYILSSSSDRFPFPMYGLGDDWGTSDDDGGISSYPPPPAAPRRDHR